MKGEGMMHKEITGNKDISSTTRGFRSQNGSMYYRVLFIVTLAFSILIIFLGTGKMATGSRKIHLSQTRQNDSPLLSQTTIYEWDDMDSRRWIAEPWGDAITVDWTVFDSRKVLKTDIVTTGINWALMRTDSFPPENWESKTGLRVDIYQSGGATGIDIKLEVRGPEFDSPDLIQSIYCNDINRNAWTTCTWAFSGSLDFSDVSHLSVVFDHLANTNVTFYLDNLRLVSASGEEAWDEMDDGSREWFYFGNWAEWNPNTPFGLEPISHKGANPVTPAGSAYLQWDYDNGCISCTLSSTVELGTGKLDDLSDWRGFNRISADVRISDSDAPLSVFLWDEDGETDPLDCRGFGTPTARVDQDDTWQTIIWDFPWPPCFDNTSIDELKFVVNGIDTYQTGNLYIDNVRLISDTLPAPASGLPYIFEDFNDRNPAFNDFNGNWGVLNGDEISVTFESDIYRGSWGSSQKISYDLPEDQFTGIWHSLWGHSAYTQTHSIDFTDLYGDFLGMDRDIEQIQFWVRGSGMTSSVHNIKIELKDISGDFNRTAYRYITIDDADTSWQQVVLDADVTNADFWSYNGSPPDPTTMKQMVFVIESYFNHPTGTFFIDDIQFIDSDDAVFDPDTHSDDQFLEFVSGRTFLYFMDWYNPDTGLVQDRSIFPDLYSTAATGFGLTALAIGESQGWVDRALAVEMITTTLNTLYDGHSPADTVTDVISGTNGYRGFYYHFLDSDGTRKIDGAGVGSELSPVDTAILLMGVMTVREYFWDEPGIVNLADAIYERVEWDWMLDPGNDLFYLAWKPELDSTYGYTVPAPGGGYFSTYHWDYYTDEVILINLLAMGSPTTPIPKDVFYAWARNSGSYGSHTLIHSWNGSLFTYTFAHLWIDFEALGEDNHPTTPVNWWQNSIDAALANWQFSVDHHDDVPCNANEEFTTYSQVSWGLTAAEGPDEEDSYRAYGALPTDTNTEPVHDGTIAPYGAGMSTFLVPEKSIPTLVYYFENTDLWRYRFGFGDAYNQDPPVCGNPWYNHALFGIDQGPLLIGIANYRSGLVWETLKSNPYLQNALCAIGHCIYLPLVVID